MNWSEILGKTKEGASSEHLILHSTYIRSLLQRVAQQGLRQATPNASPAGFRPRIKPWQKFSRTFGMELASLLPPADKERPFLHPLEIPGLFR